MTEAEWLTCDEPRLLAQWLERGALSPRKVRWFGAACCRLLIRQTPDWPEGRLIPLLEHLADGDEGCSVPTEIESGWGRYAKQAWTGPPPWACEDNVLEAALSPKLSQPGATSEENFGTVRRRLSMAEIVANMEYALGSSPGGANVTLAALLRDTFGNPFRPVSLPAEWRTDTALSLAKQMYESRDFSAMPILADALQDAGCDTAAVMDHCRGSGPHVRGCWVVDLVLGKE